MLLWSGRGKGYGVCVCVGAGGGDTARPHPLRHLHDCSVTRASLLSKGGHWASRARPATRGQYVSAAAAAGGSPDDCRQQPTVPAWLYSTPLALYWGGGGDEGGPG